MQEFSCIIQEFCRNEGLSNALRLKSELHAVTTRGRGNSGMASMTDRKAQLVTLRAFLMLAVITVAIATFTAIVSVWPGP